MNGRFVAYFRESTDRQGLKGLGMDAQQSAVSRYLNGGKWELLETYREIESGKKGRRKALTAALDHCKRENATLIIAKLDRLSRDVQFIAELQNAGVDFVCCDLPGANKMTIQMMAVLAQAEREAISTRTKDALAEIKKKFDDGKTHMSKKGREIKALGHPNGTPESAMIARAAHSKKADEYVEEIYKTVKALRSSSMTLYDICERMTEMRRPLPRGGLKWTPTAVSRVLQRGDARVVN